MLFTKTKKGAVITIDIRPDYPQRYLYEIRIVGSPREVVYIDIGIFFCVAIHLDKCPDGTYEGVCSYTRLVLDTKKLPEVFL